ncbi:iron complex outermembrane receptor protein [Gillisia mitskevichiae]|uniref:Iron complex outermembrane receptor protein n=1 Tax=Gillisia mitskevichiae TaxID=270921 RepID=A0A495P1W9_9FLAO|nr:TonB-dependent receptor [Gillisia mitskevichiae]RKS43378.1 iron complex outermembrane receptor protein [Gillisia mitskevichiae]
MKKFILVVFLLFSAVNISAQVVKGKIIDAKTSEPIENVKIFETGSEVFVFSDSEGSFEIKTSTKTIILEISALGYSTSQIKANPSSVLTIALIPSTENLSEIVITGALISKTLQSTPGAISVLTSEDLQKKDDSNFAQVFNAVPGVYVNQGALNTTKLNIRGIGARSQFSTNRIQAYFNGIPLTTGEGELTIDDFDAEAISKIEIIKGPTSSMYGAGLGGVINMFAANAEIDKTQTGISTQIGSFNTNKKTISGSHGTENTSLFATFSDLKSDGYRANGSYKKQSALINANVFTENGNKLSILGNFTKLKAFIPSSLNENDYLNDPEKAAFTWGSSKGFESYDRGLLGVSYLHHFSNRLTNLTSLFVNFRDAYEPRPFNILKEERVATGARTKFNLKMDVFELASELSFGAEYYKEWYNMQTFENLYQDFEDQGSVLGNSLSNNEQDRGYANFFGQLNLELSEKLNLETGFNINTTSYSLKDLYVQDEIDQSGDYRFKTVFSPRLGLSYEINKGKNIYTSISHGFSTPTVEETLTPEGQINTDLKPETGINYEIGFKGNWLNNRLYTEVALYSIQIENLLVAQRISEDQYVGINAGKTNHNGIETTIRYNLDLSSSITIQPYFNAALNYFEFEEFVDREQDFSGNNLPGIPKSTLNTGFELNYTEKFSLYTNLLAVGEIQLNDANSLSTENYQLLDIKARYDFKLFKKFDANFSAGVNNVLDEKYASSVLPNAVGFGGAAPRYYYPGNPRNYFVGAGLNYIF